MKFWPSSSIPVTPPPPPPLPPIPYITKTMKVPGTVNQDNSVVLTQTHTAEVQLYLMSDGTVRWLDLEVYDGVN